MTVLKVNKSANSMRMRKRITSIQRCKLVEKLKVRMLNADLTVALHYAVVPVMVGWNLVVGNS